MRDGLGLARARARDDEKRPRAMSGSFLLPLIETCEVVS